MTTFRLNDKPSLSAPVGSAIMPVEVDVGGGVFELQKITQANLFASPLGLGSTTANTGRFTTLEATTSLTTPTLTIAGIDMTPSAGTFTPVFLGSVANGTPVYSIQEGGYRYLGNDMIWVQGRIGITSKGGIDGNVYLGGLPFNVRSGSGAQTWQTFGIGRHGNLTASNGFLTIGNTATAQPYVIIYDGSTNTILTASNITDTATIRFGFFYRRA